MLELEVINIGNAPNSAFPIMTAFDPVYAADIMSRVVSRTNPASEASYLALMHINLDMILVVDGDTLPRTITGRMVPNRQYQ